MNMLILSLFWVDFQYDELYQLLLYYNCYYWVLSIIILSILIILSSILIIIRSKCSRSAGHVRTIPTAWFSSQSRLTEAWSEKIWLKIKFIGFGWPTSDFYNWAKRIKFLSSVTYGSPRRHSDSSRIFKKNRKNWMVGWAGLA